MGDALNRGTCEGARCEECPFSTGGGPTRPVFSEYPDDPLWIVIGEGPGFHETKQGRPFIGASGQVVNQILHKIGRPRDQLFVGNATLCQPPQGSPVEERERAAACCKPRLQAELAQFPGKPILTLGAVAARAIIPKESLDAIDPPDVPKTRKKSQKEKQKAASKDAKKESAAIEKIASRRFKKLLKIRQDQLKHQVIRLHHRRPDRAYLERETERDHKQLWLKATANANVEYHAKQKEMALAKQARVGKKSTKKKPIKITDIVGTLFDVDVDGSGVRSVIPAIHPAALLRGGGATIGGSHTPDMAFINIIYDAGKVDALGKGRDIRLTLDVEYELTDPDKAAQLMLNILQDAIDDNQVTIDLETYVDDVDRHHALMAYVAKIRVIGISSKHRRVSVLWDLLPSWCFSYLQFVLGNVPTVYHNALYDRTVLRAYGFILPSYGVDPEAKNFEDTLLAHHAAFPGNSHRLQNVVSQFFGVGPWKAEFRNQEETLDKLAVYNGLDTGGTQALVAPLMHWTRKTKTERIYELDKRMSDIASRMHISGIPIDREVNSQLVRTFTRLAKDSRDAVETQARDPKTLENVRHHLALQLAQKKRKADADDFEERYNVRLADTRTFKWNWKINNSKHISSLLQAMGVPLIQTTEGGAVSTKKSVLESLVDHQIVQSILTYRQNNKMLDFVWPIFDRIAFDPDTKQDKIIQHGFADGNDRIHPIWSIHKISGRWAASEPFGVSNAPREKTKKVPVGTKLHPDTIILKVLCKTCEKAEYEHKADGDHKFVAGFIEYAQRPTTKRQVVARKGRKLVGFDFAQIEARILALISGDEFMCEVFGRGGDLHAECARVVFPGFDQKTASERKMARTVCKTLEYAAFYGASDDKVWKGLLQEGYTFKFQDVVGSLNVLRRKMSGIIRWQRETIQMASQPPYELRDFVGGRRRVWPMGQVEASEALNIVPQSTGAAIMNTGMFKMDQRLVRYKEAFCIAQIHDAAVFECDEDDTEPIKQDIIECFTYEHTNEANGKTVQFPVEVDIGQCWSEV